METPIRAFLIPTVAAALFAAGPSFAQDAAAPKAAASAARKPAPKARPAAKGEPRLARSAQKAVEENTPVDEDMSLNLTEAELATAQQVQTGEMQCELGATVRVAPARRPGVFIVTTKGYRFVMHPVESRTGAIRIEDPRRGAMWLQLGNKSMLMSQKLGQRLADECQSPQQKDVAEDLRRNPRPSILEPLPAASPAAAASAPASAALPVAPASAAAAAVPGVPASAPAVPASAPAQ